MEKLNKKEIENKLQKALAIEYLREYCSENKISIEKLQNEIFQLSYNQCGFFHPNNNEPNGLLNDIDTLPKTTLVIRCEEGKLLIEQTEFTTEYLTNEL